MIITILGLDFGMLLNAYRRHQLPIKNDALVSLSTRSVEKHSITGRINSSSVEFFLRPLTARAILFTDYQPKTFLEAKKKWPNC